MDGGLECCCMRKEEEDGGLVYKGEGPSLRHVMRIEVRAHEDGSSEPGCSQR